MVEILKAKLEMKLFKKFKNNKKSSQISMLIDVDKEGGTVTRISQYLRKEQFRLPQFLYCQGRLPKSTKDTQFKCHFLQELGINVSLASVCDVSINRHDFIYKRTFSQDVKKTSQYVKCVVDEMRENKERCVFKHFPGLTGNDMFIGSQPKVQLSAIYKVVKTGKMDKKIFNEAVLRVLSWKENIGLFQ